MHAVFAPTRRKLGRLYGNALLSRFPISAWRRVSLSQPDRERRAAVLADISVAGRSLKVASTHFGLNSEERSAQATRLLGTLETITHRNDGQILLGDFNEWRVGAEALTTLNQQLGGGKRHPSFPSLLPWMPLDRIWVAPPEWLRWSGVADDRDSILASDHRPVIADLTIPQHSSRSSGNTNE